MSDESWVDMYGDRHIDVSAMKGLTLSKIVLGSGEVEGKPESIDFYTTDGRHFRQCHQQECCEHVWVEDIEGDLDDLIGSPLVVAEVASQESGEFEDREDRMETYTWAFYKLDTVKGGVVIRWNGESNGYYSEKAEFIEELSPVVKDQPAPGDSDRL